MLCKGMQRSTSRKVEKWKSVKLEKWEFRKVKKVNKWDRQKEGQRGVCQSIRLSVPLVHVCTLAFSNF